ncbi:YopX family protein [Enterococcus sp. E5-103]|uniref:YopX family protein n=1 Tax=Enterococcus sp. E5-103 TaxID=3002976 RepID=UPI002D7F9EAD|nr:YopX family protein [Enterococcus sp. E5-103]MEB4770810.1 YopX family protein [Enterococcus sp. E5-103]
MIPKFRVWDKNTNDMVNVKIIDLEKDGSIGCIVDYNGIDLDMTECVIMQSTGVKDKNGVEIFEDDIVKVTVNNYGTGERFEQIDKVVYEDCRFCFNDGFYYSETIKYSGYENKEVIGNVYENPELLEGN